MCFRTKHLFPEFQLDTTILSCTARDGDFAPNPSLDSAHRKKVVKYRDEAQLTRCLVRGALVQPMRAEEETQVRFASATISWRHVWSSESTQSLRELGLMDRELAQYSTYALRGSWRNWVRFGASTYPRMGRGRPENLQRRSSKHIGFYNRPFPFYRF
jgi:hypothetical protein